ncbi:MAG TPA: di-trans,poly-cis-decaprenylcistransferase, partial [Gammaproteobacteria bacterium]|nr:di-trans,poly-cis-decaprenylcistransferase [Gammaproteobacteria bacterium]
DGNGRWAQQRSLPRTAGHREGAKAVRRVVEACVERDIAVLTLFAFSSENWCRPRREVEILMNLFLTTLRGEIRRLDVANVRLRFIGDHRAFSPTLQDYIRKAEQRTMRNTGLTLVIAANYGGRWDIVQAAKQAAA